MHTHYLCTMHVHMHLLEHGEDTLPGRSLPRYLMQKQLHWPGALTIVLLKITLQLLQSGSFSPTPDLEATCIRYVGFCNTGRYITCTAKAVLAHVV